MTRVSASVSNGMLDVSWTGFDGQIVLFNLLQGGKSVNSMSTGDRQGSHSFPIGKGFYELRATSEPAGKTISTHYIYGGIAASSTAALAAAAGLFFFLS